MIHYHGLPITPATAAVRAISGGHAFVSFRHPEQLTIALEVAQSFAVDNGAFSAWRSGEPIDDWRNGLGARRRRTLERRSGTCTNPWSALTG